MRKINKIVIIGTGNVAYHLGKSFIENNFNVSGIWGRSEKNTSALCEELGTTSISSLTELPKDTDLVLICVSDSAIAKIIEAIPTNYPLAYTSGSISLDSLPKRKQIGVFYPLQTFSKQQETDISQVPILLESEDREFLEGLHQCASQLSKNVQNANSEERFHLHIAAVMVNNFSNHLYHLASEHLQTEGLSFELLKPLILETAKKIQTISPQAAQTGPAKRNDHIIIENHIKHLKEDLQPIYRLLSESIIKYNR